MTQTVPTDEQLKAYADKLPEVYRIVLSAFPTLAPDRQAGDGLSLETLDPELSSDWPAGYRTQDLIKALDQLERKGFIEQEVGRSDGLDFCYPTPLGERLITALTGRRPAVREIPPLPEPSWG